jgi:hypothetical protein
VRVALDAEQPLDHALMTLKLGGAEWLGIEPLGAPAERGHVHAGEHGHLAKRPEGRTYLGREQLRLLPGREVVAQ